MKLKNLNSVISKLKQNVSFSSTIFDNFRDNKEVAIHAITYNYNNFSSLSPKFKEDYDIWKTLLDIEPYFIKNIPNFLENDKNLALIALKKNPESYQYLSKSLLSDKDICFLAVKHYSNFKSIPKKYQNDKIFIEQSINFNSSFSTPITQFLPIEILKNRDLMLKAVELNPLNFKHIDKSLQEDKEIIFFAIQSPGNFQLLNENIKNDINFVKKLINKSHGVFQYVNESMQNDKELALQTVSKWPYAIKYLGKDLILDKEILLNAVKINKFAYNEFPKEIKKLCKKDNCVEKLIELIYKEKNDSILKKLNDKILNSTNDKIYKI